MSDDQAALLLALMSTAVACVALWWLWRWSGKPWTPKQRRNWYCNRCGTEAPPVPYRAGSLIFELLLWMCGLLPGLLYHLWRSSRSYWGCPACRAEDVIPPDSPRAKLAARA